MPDPGDDDERASLDDASWLQRLANGDGSALEPLLLRHATRVTNYLTRLLGDADRADDLTQDTFVRVLGRAHQYDASHPPLVWILRIARNLAVDSLRRERAHRRALRRVGEHAATATSADDPVRAQRDREFLHDLDTALQGLAEPFRTAFVLREFELLEYTEIAAVLEIPPKTVSSRLSRARAWLRDKLSVHLEEDDR